VVDGFYEWDKEHRPTWFHRSDGGLVLFRGLYKKVLDSPPRFTILTTQPNRLVAAVHDRMPLIVPTARIDDWLTNEASRVLDLIASAPEDALIGTPVSTHVNIVRNDDPKCVLPVERAMGDPQGSLF